jgi:hypothetical protein
VIADPGAPVTVDLFLVEHVTNGTPSRLVAEHGLSSSAYNVAVDLPTSSFAGHSLVTSVSANTTDFNEPLGPELFVAADHDSAHVRQLVDIAQPTGPVGADDGAGSRSVYLGSVTVTAGPTPGTTTFLIADIPGTEDTFTIDLSASDAVDPAIAPTSFQVTVLVPEPAFFVPLAACLPVLSRRRRR